MDKILVEEYRGDILECVHRGHICGISDDGIKYSVGDMEFLTFFRSSAKPIQAIPIVKEGLYEKYGFTDRELAVMTASHRAEPFHVEAIESIIVKLGINEEALICLPTYPLGEAAKENLIRENKSRRRIYHNCSGKHLGIITLCLGLGIDIGNYFEIGSAAQEEILNYISLMTEYPKENIKIGVDGCGVPVFAVPLKHLAKAYLKMACPDLIEDIEVRKAVEKITRVMNENYEMVAGTDRICSILLMDKNIVAKGGAKGVYCFALREERLGFAIKVMDGAEEQWPFIVISILEQIGYKNKETIKRLKESFPADIKNDNKRVVGTNKTIFNMFEK
ncbi:asparaginase [Clostridium swellfunianum]|uniref:asparaginase n=1 Tax=Clostridium swellfunianum TaxID=1367462 RepID=UPI002030830D|nr:asparaginase [Clostridium swellfunianum]MCM0647463.1 asparaginase [Clostridium swellfunianum]